MAMWMTYWTHSRRSKPALAALAFACVAGLLPADFTAAESSTDAAHRAMVHAIESHAPYGPRPIGARVLDVMARVPRHEFVPESVRASAYLDMPLPIGEGQTISQPYIVALMTELADVGDGDIVLEIGTGSGYQAAVLSKLASKVFTIEIVEPLGRRAAKTLAKLGYNNVETRIGDGYKGWSEHAPFDAIVVTAAPEEIPQPLIDQLAPGGTMVVPVGGVAQELTVLKKDAGGTITKREVLPVRFVPFTRDP